MENLENMTDHEVNVEYLKKVKRFAKVELERENLLRDLSMLKNRKTLGAERYKKYVQLTAPFRN